MKKILLSLGLLSSLVLTVGCTSTGRVINKYPERHIDRPYTIPKWMGSWTTNVGTVIPTQGEQRSSTLINPFNWETAINDDFTLLWYPLPLGFRWQLQSSEQNYLGLTAYYFFLGGLASLEDRYKINEDLALVPKVNYLKYDYVGLFDYESTSAELGLLWQITDHFAIKPSYSYISYRVGSKFLDNLYGQLTNTTPTTTKATLRGADIRLAGFHYINRQWDIGWGVTQSLFEYTSSKLLYADFFIKHTWD